MKEECQLSCDKMHISYDIQYRIWKAMNGLIMVNITVQVYNPTTVLYRVKINCFVFVELSSVVNQFGLVEFWL